MPETDMPDDLIEFREGELDFAGWRKRVDEAIDRFTGNNGLVAEDFPDWGFADAFGDGVEPVDAARDLLAADAMGRGFLETTEPDWREKVLSW
jgi:hypothetical protein